MNNNPSILLTVVILFSMLISCQSNSREAGAANKAVDKFNLTPINEFNVTVDKYKFFNSINNGETIQNKELIDSEMIKYKLDNIGRIIKKEIHSKNKKTKEVQEFLY